MNTNAIQAVVDSTSPRELQAALGKIFETLPWQQADIPWRNDHVALGKLISELDKGSDIPLWRTHGAADPFAGVGEDWSHGSLVAFPPTCGDHGLGYGEGCMPSGISFLTKFSNVMGDSRPVGSDFSMEWLAHDDGSASQRVIALENVHTLGDVVVKIRAGEFSIHETLDAVYETPLNQKTASIAQRYIARHTPEAGYQVYAIPENSEWGQILAKVAELDEQLRPAPRNFGLMPPCAKRGEKCNGIDSIFAKIEAAGKGALLTWTGREDCTELLKNAEKSIRAAKVEVACDEILDIANGVAVNTSLDKLTLPLNDIPIAWSNIFDRLNCKNSEMLLDSVSEWGHVYTSDVRSAICEGLQDKIIGNNLAFAEGQLRETVSSLVVATAFITAEKYDNRTLNDTTGRYAGQILLETKQHVVQDLGRQACVIHNKNSLGEDIHFQLGKNLKAQYRDGHARVESQSNQRRENAMGHSR